MSEEEKERALKEKKEFLDAVAKLDRMQAEWNDNSKNPESKLPEPSQPSYPFKIEIDNVFMPARALEKVTAVETPREIRRETGRDISGLLRRPERSYRAYGRYTERYMSNSDAKRLGITVLVAGMVLFPAIYLLWQNGLPVGMQPEEFHVEVIDLNTGEQLDTDWFHYKLFSMQDPWDWTTSRFIEEDQGIDHIHEDVLEDPSLHYLLQYDGVVYPERWAEIYPGRANILGAVARPAATVFQVLDQATMDPLNVSSGIYPPGGFLMVITMAPSTASWVGYYGFSIEEQIMPSIQIQFNSSITYPAMRLVIQGTSSQLARAKVNETCMSFSMPSISNTVTVQASWIDMTAHVIDMKLMFGQEMIA